MFRKIELEIVLRTCKMKPEEVDLYAWKFITDCLLNPKQTDLYEWDGDLNLYGAIWCKSCHLRYDVEEELILITAPLHKINTAFTSETNAPKIRYILLRDTVDEYNIRLGYESWFCIETMS